MSSITPPTPMAGHSRFAEVDGNRLHFLEYGDTANPSLVVVPGITSPAGFVEAVGQFLRRHT